jgi:hypothetical protein
LGHITVDTEDALGVADTPVLSSRFSVIEKPGWKLMQIVAPVSPRYGPTAFVVFHFETVAFQQGYGVFGCT